MSARLGDLGVGKNERTRMMGWAWWTMAVAAAGALVGAAAGRRMQGRRLRAGEIDVDAVFEQVTDGVVVLDRGRNIILMNQSAADLLGMARGLHRREVVRDCFELRTSDGRVLEAEEWPSARALRGDFLEGEEYRMRRTDTGLTSAARISTAPIRDEAGRMVQVLVIYRDISERQELDAVRTRLAAIVESSDDAIIGMDLTGRVTSWNRGAERMYGFGAEEMVGRGIERVVPAEVLAEEQELLARVRRGETLSHIETSRVCKDGSIILVSLTISPIRDESGQIAGASKIARDVTAQRRMERQLQQSQKMESIGQLTGGIAHDFNNLLGVVLGNLDLLEPLLADNEPAQKRLRTAQRAAMRGADLTRRLLAFSCSEELSPTRLSLEHTVRNALELAQRALGPEIRMVTEIDRTVPDVFVDRGGLETLLLNLFLNARDAMPEGGILTVTTRLARVSEDFGAVRAGDLKPGLYACVTVSDTGHGMSKETIQRVFEPFFTTKPRGRGTGLGLAVAYGFAKQSGGSIRIYSELGIGTSVSCYLPILDGSAPELTDVVEAFADGALAGRTVLIVDDEDDLIDIARSYIEELGCRTLEAEDGRVALDLLRSNAKIDLMLTDMIMPGGISGAQLAERALALRPELKVIYCSGFPADALAERGSLAADAPLLRKPYRRTDVHACVRRAMRECAR